MNDDKFYAESKNKKKTEKNYSLKFYFFFLEKFSFFKKRFLKIFFVEQFFLGI